MPIYLKALGLKNYRGIGPDRQLMAPFREFNFFIGANNTGKSTVLNFISKWLPIQHPAHGRGPATALAPSEAYLHGTKGSPEAAIGVSREEFVRQFLQRFDDGARNVYRPRIEAIADNMTVDGFVWLNYPIPFASDTSFLEKEGASDFNVVLGNRDWQALWSAFTQRQGGSLQNWVSETLTQLKNVATYGLPEPILIPAIREIGPKGERFAEYGGRGLIDRLAEMQSPDIDLRHERLIFDKINGFLQTVTGYESAHIEIPHNREHILVHINNLVLPLPALGTGIQEVIIIASYCTINDEKMICIEEPELHLHPLLQRKLLAYLASETNNQYFIATHSAAFIDTPGAAIFHVRSEDGQTRIQESILRSSRCSVCQDLGYKASDIVQSNAVIWCEGPSDRVYLNHWISEFDPSLKEGIHYSIMFYGGRSLSHLTATDDEVTEFISLKSLNRNSAVLIDSDRSAATDKMNATKNRISEEFADGSGIAWITAGREIENYVDFDILQAAIKTVHSRSYLEPANHGDAFDHSIHFRQVAEEGADPKIVVADKVKVARLVCEAPANLDILDLKERMSELVGLIRKANA